MRVVHLPLPRRRCPPRRSLGALAVASSILAPLVFAGGALAAPATTTEAVATRDFYVSPNGSDSGPGTLARPWRTLRKAVSALRPGRRVLVRSGTYRERVEIHRSGTAAAPVQLVAYPGERTDDFHDHGIYWALGNGTIGDNLIEGSAGFGIHLYPDANGVRVTQNTVVGSGRSGIIVAGDRRNESDGNLIANNIVAFNGEFGIRSSFDGKAGDPRAGNYLANLRWLGWADAGFANGGSDELLDAIAAWGDEEAIVARVRAHLEAGADRVAIQPVPAGRNDFGLDHLRRLAPAFAELDRAG